ncbi:hypothetical protein BBAD15_g8615 [Beauveria bassiana D1-5]|uniref:Uncharacterized protein n=1 Tax=Beauveria bassiana D1-5 TaxID=1245745 RepID=A0A0A2VDT4_BEABA|nr:hypothetical protein BBAD15_g8615 [Beauveria bassiana D1-5]
MQNSETGKPARGGRFDIILVEHFNGADTHQANDFGGRGDGQGGDWQHHMAQGADDHFATVRGVREPRIYQRKAGDGLHFIQQVKAPGHREPAQGQREEQRQQQRQPEDRNRKTYQRQGADQLILPLIAHDTCQHPDRNAYQQRQAKGQNAQLHGRREYIA